MNNIPEESPNYRYLANGRMVALMQPLDQGFLVAPVITRGDEEESEFIDYRRPFVAEEVFDEEPVERYGQKIAELESRIRDLRAEKDAMELAKRNFTTEEAQIKARCAAIPALKNVFDFIDGKITHYVIQRYSDIQIVPFGDTKTEFARTQDQKKLLSLFGASDRELTWKLNDYYDGSGSWTTCIPVLSYEEGIQEAAKLFDKAWKEGKRNPQMVQCAESLGIPVPQEVQERVKAAEIERAEKELERANDVAKAALINLEALRS